MSVFMAQWGMILKRNNIEHQGQLCYDLKPATRSTILLCLQSVLQHRQLQCLSCWICGTKKYACATDQCRRASTTQTSSCVRGAEQKRSGCRQDSIINMSGYGLSSFLRSASRLGTSACEPLCCKRTERERGKSHKAFTSQPGLMQKLEQRKGDG